MFEEAPGKLQRSETIRLQEEIFKLLHIRDTRSFASGEAVARVGEDYLAKLTKLFEMCPELPDQYLRLKPPSTSSASNIIRGPFKKHSWPTGSVISAELAKEEEEKKKEKEKKRRRPWAMRLLIRFRWNAQPFGATDCLPEVVAIRESRTGL